MPLGLYISVPFCRTKCSYCNFASGVFSASQMARYVERLSADVAAIRGFARENNADITEPADTIYLGGGNSQPASAQRIEKPLLRFAAAIQNSFQCRNHRGVRSWHADRRDHTGDGHAWRESREPGRAVIYG